MTLDAPFPILLADVSLVSRAVGIALWIGLAVLTVSLLVLMRTRFGQARPLSKCVALSVFAHVLLMGYAWGTRLIFEPPPPQAPGDYIAVSFHAPHDSRDDEPTDANHPQSLDPWETSSERDHVDPDIESPERRDVEPLETPVRREMPDIASAVGGSPTAAVERSDPAPAAPPQPSDDDLLRQERSGVEAAAIDAPEPRSRTEVKPEGPTVSELDRPANVDVASPSVSAPPELPPELLSVKPRVQRLDDPVSSDVGDAAPLIDDPAAGGPRDDRGASDAATAETHRPETRDASGASNAPSASPSRGSPHSDPSADALFNSPGTPRRLGDGAEMPSLYRLRFAADRLRLVQRSGGDATTEAAVEAALAWLAANQQADGRWNAARHGAGIENSVLGHNREGAGANADTGITGLAVLAFLGAGQSHLEGRYRENVQHGLEFLLRSQRKDGSLAGDARLFAMMYCHGMASLAISEAYAMTGDARIKPFVQRAIAYTVNSQHRGSGGWRYQPGDAGDMSQFGWQVMALASAERAGLPIGETTRSGMLRFMRSVSSGRSGGLYSYRPNEGASRTMTAEGLSCRHFLQLPRDAEAEREAIEYLSQELPSTGQANLYYWYYATLALHQTESDLWPEWNAALKRQLTSRQQTAGDLAGSWAPDTRWGGYGGRVYSTALACLCLEVYYRYLPMQAGR
jgi:hypothetical protein